MRENAGIVILGAQISSSALLLAARYDTAFLRLCLWLNTKCVHFLEQTDVYISSWYVVGPTLCLVSGYVHLRGLERCFHSVFHPFIPECLVNGWYMREEITLLADRRMCLHPGPERTLPSGGCRGASALLPSSPSCPFLCFQIKNTCL